MFAFHSQIKYEIAVLDTNEPYIYKIQQNVAFEVAQFTAMFLKCIHIQTLSLNN